MGISMIGIDYNKASVDIRALFAFTKKNAGEAMEIFAKQPGILGCIVLSTCNRMEIWASTETNWEGSLYEVLCSMKGVNPDQYRDYFVTREQDEAVEHLFYLTSGLKSQILGEDQILTQVKDALNLGREHFTTDSVLEVLFRMAVTAGKKIKTEVPFTRGNPSVIHQAIHYLKERGFDVDGKVCMVIGNGEMGKVAAQTLTEFGADVTVTVRQYRSGLVSIPQGCKRINYGERMEYLPKCDLVVSATASPNFTLRLDLFEPVTLEKPLVLVDLAVPRDIEPVLGEHPMIQLYDMDTFHMDSTCLEVQECLEQAGTIVKEQMDEFYVWLKGRDVIPRIQEIQSEAVNDLNLRIQKLIKAAPMETEEKEKLLQGIDRAAGKVVSKMIFGLRDTLEQEAFLACVAGLEKLYED